MFLAVLNNPFQVPCLSVFLGNFYPPNDAQTILPENPKGMCVKINLKSEHQTTTAAATTAKSLGFFVVLLRSLSCAWIVCFHSTLQINDSIYYKTFPYFQFVAATVRMFVFLFVACTHCTHTHTRSVCERFL